MASKILPILLYGLIYFTGAGAIGVNYGRVADNLPTPQQAVQLLKTTSFTKIKLYDADPSVLKALANTSFEVIAGFPNELITLVARKQRPALYWIKQNILSHLPATKIIAISVGNEISSFQNLAPYLVPAMQNLHKALVAFNLHQKIKLSSPLPLSVLSNSFPPSAGAFRPDLSSDFLHPLLNLLAETNSFLMVNAYPYFAHRSDPSSISLDYALFRSNPGVKDSETGLMYYNLFDAQVDAIYSAMAELGHHNLPIIVTETGWPAAGDSSETGASVENAASYNTNLLKHIRMNSGTPLKPNLKIEAYIFALFDEDLKPGPTSERNFGLFYHNQVPVYDIGVQRKENEHGSEDGSSSPGTWCVAKSGVSQNNLQAALDYACGPGGADCAPIQAGGSCFVPDTLQAHASYAFNSYFQKNKGKGGSCDFAGSAIAIHTNPSFLKELRL